MSAASGVAAVNTTAAALAQKWPCKGVNPYKCDKCPSKVIASHMLQDLETSCNIPSWLGLETE